MSIEEYNGDISKISEFSDLLLSIQRIGRKKWLFNLKRDISLKGSRSVEEKMNLRRAESYEKALDIMTANMHLSLEDKLFIKHILEISFFRFAKFYSDRLEMEVFLIKEMENRNENNRKHRYNTLFNKS